MQRALARAADRHAFGADHRTRDVERSEPCPRPDSLRKFSRRRPIAFSSAAVRVKKTRQTKIMTPVLIQSEPKRFWIKGSLDPQRMPHLRGHLLGRRGQLALRKLLVGEIEYDENDSSGSQ
jgi:hypothetical protein